MKIKILNQDGEAIRVFHEPREVIVRPKQKVVEILDGKTKTEYPYTERKITWLDSKLTDCSEAYIELHVVQ